MAANLFSIFTFVSHFCMILLYLDPLGNTVDHPPLCPTSVCQAPLYMTVILVIKAKNVPVKIIEEPAAYRGANTYYQQHQTRYTKELETRVDPIPFSGPSHLAVLNGKCFSLIENGYKYELCPFHNITQKEQTVRWNAFSGVLGVFQGWVIVNNTFNSMLMNEGDLCPGSNPRQTKVYLRCGDEHALLSVTEPRTCHYEMNFQTPLACPQDAMLVYPVLSLEGQSTWESIEEGMWREELTLQGYNKRRKKLFMSEGFVAPDEKAQEDTVWRNGEMERKNGKRSVQKGENVKGKNRGPFLTLQQCSFAYDELYAEVERLRKLVIPFNKDESTYSREKKAYRGSISIAAGRVDEITGTTRRSNSLNKDQGREVTGFEININEDMSKKPGFVNGS